MKNITIALTCLLFLSCNSQKSKDDMSFDNISLGRTFKEIRKDIIDENYTPLYKSKWGENFMKIIDGDTCWISIPLSSEKDETQIVYQINILYNKYTYFIYPKEEYNEFPKMLFSELISKIPNNFNRVNDQSHWGTFQDKYQNKIFVDSEYHATFLTQGNKHGAQIWLTYQKYN